MFVLKMFFKSVGVVAIAVLCFSQCSAQTCSGQYPSDIVNNRCEMQCGAQKCLCSSKPNSSSNKTFNACSQRCDRSPTGSNDTVTNCMDMKCSDLDTCHQTCNTDSCSMECKAKTRCNQECGSGCTKMLCSASECHQQCTNCTMECTSETKTCYHLCYGGVCHSKCAAESCNPKCMAGSGISCKIIYSTAKRHTLAYLYIILGSAAYFIT